VNGPLNLRKSIWLSLGLCVAILAPRAYLAVHDQGMIWADEIFQTLEPGHRLAFGYGLVPWEFQFGARSWLLPGLIGGFMKLLAAFGLDHGLGLAIGTKLLFALGAAVTFYPLLRLAHVMGGTAATLLLGIGAIAFPASLLYSSRALAEVACAPLVTWSLWALWPSELASGSPQGRLDPKSGTTRATARRMAGVGFLLGLATVLRYQNVVLLVAFIVIVAARHSRRGALALAAGGLAALLVGGLLDWVTWGRPFQSTIIQLRFNLIWGGGERWGVSPPSFYLRAMLASNGPALLVLVLGFVAGLARTWPVAVPALLFLAIHSVVPHKELRFLYPALPLFLMCAAVGLAVLIERARWLRKRPAETAALLAGALVLVFGLHARRVTFEDIGQGDQVPGEAGPQTRSVWGCLDQQNRLLADVGGRADLCGLILPDANAYWTGGYSYLRRRVPILWPEDPGVARTAFSNPRRNIENQLQQHVPLVALQDLDAANYALLSPDQKMGDPRYQIVGHRGGYALFRRDGSCRPPRDLVRRYGRLRPIGVEVP
jgi:hypothetical protein